MREFLNDVLLAICGFLSVALIIYLFNTSFLKSFFTGATVFPLETEISWDKDNKVFESTTLEGKVASLVISINGNSEPEVFDCEVDNIVNPQMLTSLSSTDKLGRKKINSGRLHEEGIKIKSLNIPSDDETATVFIGKAGKKNLSIRVSNNEGELPKIILLPPIKAGIYLILIIVFVLFIRTMLNIFLKSIKRKQWIDDLSRIRYFINQGIATVDTAIKEDNDPKILKKELQELSTSLKDMVRWLVEDKERDTT